MQMSSGVFPYIGKSVFHGELMLSQKQQLIKRDERPYKFFLIPLMLQEGPSASISLSTSDVSAASTSKRSTPPWRKL